MRFLVLPVLLLVCGCTTAGTGNTAMFATTYDENPVTSAVAPPVQLLIEDGPQLHCTGTFDQTLRGGILSSALVCDDDRTGTVSLRHSGDLMPGSGYFILDDGTKRHVIFVSNDGKTLTGRLENPRRRPDYFIPPRG